MHDVTVVIADLSEGGAQRVVCTLCDAWAKAGRSTAVITLSTPATDFFPLPSAVTRISTGQVRRSGGLLSGFLANLRRLYILRRTIRETASPVVVAFVGTTNVLAILATRGLRIRLVISERNDPARQSLGPVWDLLRWLLYRCADIVTANSRSALASLASYVPRDRLIYVPNPLYQQNMPPKSKRQKLIVNIGRLTQQKGQDILLSAFAQIVHEASGWRLAIAGSGELESELKTHARALGIIESVDFLGQTDPWPLLAKAAVFALPSKFEGTPNALLEAMSMGVASIVSDSSGGALEYVDDGKTGLIVRTGDSENLANALLRLMTNEQLRKKLGSAARRRVEECNLPAALSIWDDVLNLAAPSRGYENG